MSIDKHFYRNFCLLQYLKYIEQWHLFYYYDDAILQQAIEEFKTPTNFTLKRVADKARDIRLYWRKFEK
jgi:hypothetical protein